MTAAAFRPLVLMRTTFVLGALVAVTALVPGAAAVSTSLVINEVDYDQASTDMAEFLELKNVSASAISLDPFSVEFVNGTGGGAALYRTLDLPNVSLAAGDYYVICANAATVANCDLDGTPDTDFIQNGAPDALGLRIGTTLVDALSYEGDSGAPYTEGSGAGLVDDPVGTNGVSRCPDGDDTDSNSSDFRFAASTPGAANVCPAPPVAVAIHSIQGATHRSLYTAQNVSTTGIVTTVGSNGFWLQEPTVGVDADPETSEALFVFTSSTPTVAVGDALEVVGTVAEFRPGGSGGTNNLTTTELTSPVITTLSSGNALPAETLIGAGGRVPPGAVIDDDATTGDVETSGSFDGVTDGIDFWESLEGMLVQLNGAVAVGPTSQFGEIPVVGDTATIRTGRGGVVISADDFNPERIFLDDTLLPTPDVNVGDGFSTPVRGVIDYSFTNFKLNVTTALARVDRGLVREATAPQTDHQIAVATYNVENLDPADTTFARHADLIVNHLRSPDLIAIEEIQDSSGPTNDGVTDATATWNALIAAVAAAGGPTYQFRQINPVDGQDGGEPGGNIRVGFLFRTDRELEFIDRAGGTSTSATTVVPHPSGPRLSASPGRVDPANAAFANSRKPLAGEFRMRGKKVFVIVNHFNSKGGDQPLFGRFQPPARVTETQRHAQAQVVNNFVDAILAADPNANVIVLGDINDFEFSQTVSILEGGALSSLMNRLPKPERYSYVFEGNSQVLDQILVSRNLGGFPIAYDVVHVNSEFVDQASDHDPQVAKLDLRGPRP